MTALSDIRKAMEVVRARALEWSVRSGKGRRDGILRRRRSRRSRGHGARRRPNPRPAFQAPIYPAIPDGLALSNDTPPAVLACGENDRQNISLGLPELYLARKRADASAELHVYAGVGHGFGLRPTTRGAVAGWMERFRDFLETPKLLK